MEEDQFGNGSWYAEGFQVWAFPDLYPSLPFLVMSNSPVRPKGWCDGLEEPRFRFSPAPRTMSEMPPQLKRRRPYSVAWLWRGNDE